MPDPRSTLILGLSLAQLITWGSVFYTFALLIGPIEAELGASRAQSSLAFSLALLVEGLCAFQIGRWIDAGHERRVMALGSALAGSCLLAHGLVASLAGFYAVWAGLGVAMAATLYTPVFAVVTRRFPLDYRRAIITMTFLGGLASTVFIPLTAWLIATLGWRAALAVLAALQFGLCLPIHLRLLRHAPAPSGSRPGTPTTPATAPAPELHRLLRSAPFVYVGVFVVLSMAVTAALPAHMVSLLRERGVSEAWAIAVPASVGVIQVLGRMLLFFFEHRFDVHLANRAIPCLVPAGLAALLLASWAGKGALGLTLVLVFVLLFGMGQGMITIVKGTAVAQYVSHDQVASLNGAMGLPLALARAAAPLLLGLLWTAQAGYRHGLVLMLVLSLLAIAGILMAQSHARATGRGPT